MNVAPVPGSGSSCCWSDRSPVCQPRHHRLCGRIADGLSDHHGRRIPVDDPKLDPVWKKAGELGMPVLIHTADPKQFWEMLQAFERDQRSKGIQLTVTGENYELSRV